MRHAFVNGGVGFIGHHLSVGLQEAGFEVIAIDRMEQLRFHRDIKYYDNFIRERLDLLDEKGIKLVSIDTSDTDEYSRLLREYDPSLIYHMSAIASAKICQTNPNWAFSENLVNVEKVLECIRLESPETRFVFASSSVAYGEFPAAAVTEETPLKPMNFYGLTKKNSEELIKIYNRSFGLNYTIIRPSALYGPRCVNRRVSQIMIENILEGKPVKLFGGGLEKLDFTFVLDAVQGFVKAGTLKGGLNETFNITYGMARPVLTLVDILRQVFPDIEVKEEERDQNMPVRGTLVVDKARKLVDYQPAYPLEKGYPKYINWYLQRKDELFK